MIEEEKTRRYLKNLKKIKYVHLMGTVNFPNHQGQFGLLNANQYICNVTKDKCNQMWWLHKCFVFWCLFSNAGFVTGSQ